MGRGTGIDAIREAASRPVKCYLCMQAQSSQVVEGFGTTLVYVCDFCYTALQWSKLEGNQHDTDRTG